MDDYIPKPKRGMGERSDDYRRRLNQWQIKDDIRFEKELFGETVTTRVSTNNINPIELIFITLTVIGWFITYFSEFITLYKVIFYSFVHLPVVNLITIILSVIALGLYLYSVLRSSYVIRLFDLLDSYAIATIPVIFLYAPMAISHYWANKFGLTGFDLYSVYALSFLVLSIELKIFSLRILFKVMNLMPFYFLKFLIFHLAVGYGIDFMI